MLATRALRPLASLATRRPLSQLVVSVVGPDRGGLVSSVTRAIAAHDGNVVESSSFSIGPVFSMAMLVEAGADVPTGNLYGRSALHNAAKRDDSAAAEFLIEHGARLNQVCEYGTPLDLTANCEIAEVLQIAGGGASSDKSIASRTHDNYLTPLPSEK